MNDDPHSVSDIEAWLGGSLPGEYRSFLETCEVEWSASDLVLLYGRALFIERNETYETREYCPGFVTIGNDSGDREVLMSLEDASVYLVDGGSMQMEMAEPLNARFATWFGAHCPIPKAERDASEWPVDPLTPVCIYLENRPSSLCNLLMIKRELEIDTSMAELKEAAGRTPCCIADGLTYAAAKVLCRRVNDEDRCVGIRLAADESRRLLADGC